MSQYFEACPRCQSPNFEDSGNYFKCLDCAEIFEFPDELTIVESCPDCGCTDIDHLEWNGKPVSKCSACGHTWLYY